MTSKKIQVIGLIFVLIMFVLIIARVFIEKDKGIKNEDDYEATAPVLEQVWQLRHIGESGLKVIAPEGLEPVEIKLSEEAKKTIDAYGAYEYTLESFGLRINHLVAKEDVDSEVYAEKLAEMIKKSKKVKKYKYTISPLIKGDDKGSFLNGTASKVGLEIEIDSVILVRGNRLWDVTVSFNNTNEKLKDLAEKILNSVEIQ